MIIAGDFPLKIGEVIRDKQVSDSNAKYHNIPFLVIREATREEYLKQCEEHSWDKLHISPGPYYYEVSID